VETAPPAPAPPGSTSALNLWDGSSWAAGAALPTLLILIAFAGAGVSNSLLTFAVVHHGPSVGKTTQSFGSVLLGLQQILALGY
jgi:hypothetical protein